MQSDSVVIPHTDDDENDVQWFNVHLKLTRNQLSLAHSAKVKTDMPEMGST